MSDLFSTRLKLLRGSRSKAVFSRFLGIPAPMYHRYEDGQIPKSDNLRVIAAKCNTTVDWLLGGKAEGIQPPGSEPPVPPAALRESRAPPEEYGILGSGVSNLQVVEWRETAKKVTALSARVSELEQAMVRLTGKKEK